MRTAVTSPGILVPCLLLFAALVTSGLLVVRGFDAAAASARRETAAGVAAETDVFFARVLERALVPLHTLAQFVRALPEFHDLPFDVGPRCDPAGEDADCAAAGGAPVLTGRPTHRNLTGAFPPGTAERFAEIARGIKEQSGIGRALVGLQLAPRAVVALIYPVVNCADFDNGVCLNSTGALGHDLLNDPRRMDIARATVPAPGVVTAGPLALIQGDVPVARDAFLARLPINMPGHSLVVDGVDYPCWGFVVILLNWARLKEESDIYRNFARRGMQFLLTRTDVEIDPTTGREATRVVTLAESRDLHRIARENVTLALETGDNNLKIAVGFDDGFSPRYESWGAPIVIGASCVFTVLLMMVLVSKTQHERLLHRMMPESAIKKLRRGKTIVEKYSMVTVFFSDIVGYTTMSSEMKPLEVMEMLNRLYSQFDALCEKHGVFKVETIGDAFVAVGGAPERCSGPRGAEKLALFALDALRMVEEFRTSSGARIYMRMGLASGSVVAGVVGTALPRYALFGDTMNLASRMESTGEIMRLQVAAVTHQLLMDAPRHDFACELRQDDGDEPGVEVKGKGRQLTWWVNSVSKLAPEVVAAAPSREGLLKRGVPRVLFRRLRLSAPDSGAQEDGRRSRV